MQKRKEKYNELLDTRQTYKQQEKCMFKTKETFHRVSGMIHQWSKQSLHLILLKVAHDQSYSNVYNIHVPGGYTFQVLQSMIDTCSRVWYKSKLNYYLVIQLIAKEW